VERPRPPFRKSDGDIRKVLKTIFDSPEFWSARQRRSRRPFEFVVSALRATGADVQDARDVARRIGEMGMPLYLQQPPTGYKDTADAGSPTSGLLARLNFALDLAARPRARRPRDVRSLRRARATGPSWRGCSRPSSFPAGLGEQTRRRSTRRPGRVSTRCAWPGWCSARPSSRGDRRWTGASS
jgi:uncharacterized protein (DUF1800 family)